MIKTLAPCLAGRNGRRAVWAMATIALEVAFEIFIPFLMADIVDYGITNGDVGYILRRGGLMVAMALVSLAFGMASARFASLSATGFAADLRGALFNKVQDFSFFNMDKYNTASLVTRLTTDVTNTQNTFFMMTRILIRAPLMLVLAVIMALRINVELADVYFVALPALAVAIGIVSAMAYPRFMAMLRTMDAMNGRVQENLTAMRVVKAFVREDHEKTLFHKASDDMRDAQVNAERLIIFTMPFANLVMYATIVAICWFGGKLIIGGSMQTGELMSFVSYTGQILSSLLMIAMALISTVLSRASVTRICEVLNETPDISDAGADPELKPADGSIRFENVDFSYSKNPDNLTLESIELDIKSGETVGIIGGTGSAKTTLVQLIPRLYDVLDGRVLVGGRDVRDYTLASLRDAVSMVLQNNVLFSGTIRDNLRWGDSRAADEDVREACRMAQADDFIMSFPDGYDTVLGQGGVNVSGGQKQRLCIARALLKKPRILILDDSTSAVDTATDAAIRAAVRQRRGDMTTLIIAQRIGSVMEADKIVVMDEGRVSAVGSHAELMRSSAIYREVYESQGKGAE